MKTAFLLAAALAGMLGTAGAQSLVNMDVNYGSSNLNFNTAPTTTTGNYNYANPAETDTVESTAFGSIPGTGSPSSNPFTGGASLGGTSIVHSSWQIVANGTSTGTFPTSSTTSRLSASGAGTGGTNDVRAGVTQNMVGGGATSASLALDLYVAKADLLNGYASVSDLTLQGLSFSVSIGFIHASTGGAASNVYFMIENGSQWYVSATSKSSTGAFSLSNASAATWYAYDPTSNLLFNTANPGTGVLGSTFSDIQAFGALGQTTNFDPTAAQTTGIAAITSLYGFQVTMVPEPSPLLLIGAGGALLAAVAAWQRRARLA